MWLRDADSVAFPGVAVPIAGLGSTWQNSTLSQTLRLTPGASYTLSYRLRNDFSPTDNVTTTNSWVVSVGGVVVDALLYVSSFDFTTRSVIFTAPAGTTQQLTFTFRQVNHITSPHVLPLLGLNTLGGNIYFCQALHGQA